MADEQGDLELGEQEAPIEALSQRALRRLEELLDVAQAQGDTKTELAVIGQIHRARRDLSVAHVKELRARITRLNQELCAAQGEVKRLETAGGRGRDAKDGPIDPRVAADIEAGVSRLEDPAPAGEPAGPGEA